MCPFGYSINASSVPTVSISSALAETMTTPKLNLTDHNLYGETSIYWGDIKTVYASSSGGMYYDYVCANDVSYVFVLPYVVNRKDNRHGIHAPLIVDSVGKVCSD